MLEHCIPTDPKDDETIIEAKNIMQYKDKVLEDLGYGIEEMQRASTFLEIARALTESEDLADPSTQSQWIAMLLREALLVTETAVGFLEHLPGRLGA